jgi:hypothetical protein
MGLGPAPRRRRGPAGDRVDDASVLLERRRAPLGRRVAEAPVAGELALDL